MFQKISYFVLTVALVLFAPSAEAVWTEPEGGTPLLGDGAEVVSPPINSGSTQQDKIGQLFIIAGDMMNSSGQLLPSFAVVGGAQGTKGRVKIGDAGPMSDGYLLEVTGDILAEGFCFGENDCITSSTGGGSLWKNLSTGGGIYYTDGKVGVGTSLPDAKMEVRGNLSTSADGTNPLPILKIVGLSKNSDGNWTVPSGNDAPVGTGLHINTREGFPLYVESDGIDALAVDAGSRVGIGKAPDTTLPAGSLDVRGDIKLGSTGTGVIFQDGTTQTTAGGQWTTSGTNIYNTNSGNVGIGNSDPRGALDVTGAVGESREGRDGVRIGVLSGTPRIVFEDGASQNLWQIDNFGGAFRWYIPGSTKMTLDTSGNLEVSGRISALSPTLNSHVATKAYVDTAISGIEGGGFTGITAGTGIAVTNPAGPRSTVSITNSGVTATQLKDSAVTTDKLANASVTGSKIAASTITNQNLAGNSVGTYQIINGSILAGDLASNAVETVKIKDLAVTSPKLADGAVANAKLGDGSVTEAKLSSMGCTTNGQILKYNGTGWICGVDDAGSGGDGASNWLVKGGNVYRSSGYVGIGTNNPLVDLQIANDNYPGFALSNISQSARAVFGLATANNNYGLGTTPGDLSVSVQRGNDVHFGTSAALENPTIRMTIKDTGYVGVGTTNPGALFDVKNQFFVKDGSYVEVKPGGSRYGFIIRDNDSADWANLDAHDGYLAVGYMNDDGPLYVTRSSVGVGKKIPGANLDVSGNLKVSTYADIGTTDNIRLGGASSLALPQGGPVNTGGAPARSNLYPARLNYSGGWNFMVPNNHKFSIRKADGSTEIFTLDADTKSATTKGILKAEGGFVIQTLSSNPTTDLVDGRMWLIQ